MAVVYSKEVKSLGGGGGAGGGGGGGKEVKSLCPPPTPADLNFISLDNATASVTVKMSGHSLVSIRSAICNILVLAIFRTETLIVPHVSNLQCP